MKKMLSILVASIAVFACGVFSVSKAEAATQSEAMTWVNQSVGKGYDFDHAYGNQCVDYVNEYVNHFFNTSFSGNAIDLQNTGVKNGFKFIKATAGAVPQAGDIFVMSVPGSPYGHTGIVISANGSTINMVNQNYNGHAYVTKNSIPYSNSYGTVVGWLRPPFSGSSSNNGGGSTNNTAIKVGDTVSFTGVYKVSKVNPSKNTVASNTLAGGDSTYLNYIDATPLVETNASGTKAGDQILNIGDYFKVPGTYKVLNIDTPTNGIYVKIGSVNVWLSASQAHKN